jgi:hypothetical protein
MSFPARPGTLLVVVTAAPGEDQTINILRFPVLGWMIAGGFLVPLTIVPPKAMPAGRHAVVEPEGHGQPLTVIDLKDFSVHETEEAWIDTVSSGLAAGATGLIYDASAVIASGPPIRDNAPGVEDPDKPKRTRRTKAQIEADEKAAAEAKAVEEARLLQGAAAAPAETVVETVEDDMI